MQAADTAGGELVTVSEIAALKANVTQLQQELADVRAMVERMARELGIAPP
jgi:cell division protein FtsB